MSVSSRLWTRFSALGRDSFHIGSEFAKAATPIIRRQTVHLTFADAFRNTLVSQARQSNGIATNLMTMQQQIGLMRYHGLMGYWRQRQGTLQAATADNTSGAAGMSTSATNGNGNSDKEAGNKNVAQVAFMITSAMRKELSEKLGYAADQIKSMTPMDASLILFNEIKPDEKDEKLPGLLEAHKAEQDKLARMEEQRQRDKQAKAEVDAVAKRVAAVTAASMEQPTSNANVADAKGDEVLAIQQGSSTLSSQPEPNEGLYKLEEAPPQQQSDGASPTTDADAITTYENNGEEPLGTFVNTMIEQIDKERDWYEVVETRAADSTQVPVGLFSSLVEAEMAMDLKKTFSERRAKEELDNKDNVPATTYTLRETRK